MILSIVLNTFVVIVLIYHWKKLKTRDFIIFSLAIADLVQSLFGFPYLIANYGRPPNEPATIQCIISALIVTVTAITAIYHIVSLSIIFYVFLKFPFMAEKLNSPLRAFLAFVLPCWLFGLLWGLLPLLGWSSYGKETNEGYRCGLNLREYKWNVVSYNVCLCFFACILPIIVTVICYVGVRLIFKSLGRSAAERNGNQSQMNRKTRRQEYSIFVLGLIMFAAFTLAWTPYASFVVMTTFKHVPSQRQFDIAAILAKTSAFYNPIIYALAYKEFRKKVFTTWNKLTSGNVVAMETINSNVNTVNASCAVY